MQLICRITVRSGQGLEGLLSVRNFIILKKKVRASASIRKDQLDKRIPDISLSIGRHFLSQILQAQIQMLRIIGSHIACRKFPLFRKCFCLFPQLLCCKMAVIPQRGTIIKMLQLSAVQKPKDIAALWRGQHKNIIFNNDHRLLPSFLRVSFSLISCIFLSFSL